MSGPRDATAGSGDSHPWALERSGERPIMRELLRGAEPVCADCHRVLEPGEPRVTVPDPSRPRAPFWRCSDCEYRSVYG